MSDPTVTITLQIPGATPGTYQAAVQVTAPPAPPPVVVPPPVVTPPPPVVTPPAPSTEVVGFTNVTPPGVDLDPRSDSNGNFGFTAIACHPARPSDLYASLDHQGIFKSIDFGRTFHGPINIGANGAVLNSGAGSLALATAGPSNPPTLYANNLRGSSLGILKSVDGGVNWTQCAPLPVSQDVYPPVIDPYDANHVLVPYHEQNVMAETTDGGQSWRVIPQVAGMTMQGGSGFLAFVDTGNAATTRTTWLWWAQESGGKVGLWRTPDSGTTWTQVETFEKPHGGGMILQRGNGEIIAGGPYGSKGWGTYRSTDYGQTWALVDSAQNGSFVATPTHVYSTFSWSAGVFEPVSVNGRVAPLPGISGWGAWPTPPASGSWTSNPVVPVTGMSNGWAGAVVVFDGTNWVIVGAHRNGGIWRYVEPAGTTQPPAPTPTPPPPTPTPPGPTAALPALTVSGNKLVTAAGKTVILRGVSSQGLGMVYGDKANPGTYLPMSVADYVKRAVQTDGQGQPWYSRAIRLCFERFPCTDPTRLYSTENVPYAMPDTIPVAPWQPSTNLADQELCASGGSRYRLSQRKWRADKGQPWNPGAYVVGDVLAGWEAPSHVYRCTAVPAVVTPNTNWGGGPNHSSGDATDSFGNTWTYLGEFGTTGTVPPSSLTPVIDNQEPGAIVKYLIDGLASWQYESPDYTPAQALANWRDWKSKVMDPAISAAKAAGLYVVVCYFDFGPAHHPLLQARLEAFWALMAQSQWADDPAVLFELWNESCDVGSFSGGPGSWAQQKPAIQAVVNAIRASATNVIIVPPPFFSARVGEATASPIQSNNIAYALHQYRSQFESYSSNRDQITQGLASGQCVIMTEWGDDTNPTDPAKTWATTSSVTPLRTLIEPSAGATNPAAGWFAWALTNSWGPDLYADAALTQPTAFGQAVRGWLSDLKGDSQP